MCRICDLTEQAMEEIFSSTTPMAAMREVIAAAHISGFAAGFNIRKETTYEEFCPQHAHGMKHALRLAGSFELPLEKGGKA